MENGKVMRAQEPVKLMGPLLALLNDQKTSMEKMIDDKADVVPNAQTPYGMHV